jgi:predicted amidohydrolase YtcJ
MEREAMKLAVARYASLGWTGLQNMSVGSGEVAMLNAMAGKGELPIRVDNYMGQDSAARVLKSGPYADKTGRVRVLGIKLFADGALGSRGAALLAPYSDAPQSTGLVLLPRKEMLAILKKAKRAKAQVAIHAIGDRGNRAVLDAFEATFGKEGGAAQRWRIEHSQVLALDDLPRFAKLGVIASMQPSHAVSDLYFAPARLGPDRLAGAYAWASLLKSGAMITAGSDAPVERGVPLEEFYAAVYRHDYEGKAGNDWHLEEAVTRKQALAMFTSAAAFASFSENDLGTLAVGKRADISVFNVDLMTAKPAAIVKGKAVMTIVDGEVVYAAK